MLQFIISGITLHSQTFQWVKSFGDTDSYCLGSSICLDAKGNIYSTGYFRGSVDFDPGPGIFNLTSPGFPQYSEIFISKLNSSGDFVWAKAIGGNLSDVGVDIAIDDSGNVYTIGYFNATADFDPGPAVYALNAASTNAPDIFISKLDSMGNFVWARTFGGIESDYIKAIKIDKSGYLYICGEFKGTVDFDPGPGINNLISKGYVDAFFCKFHPSGNLVWANSIGANYDDLTSGMAVDNAGNIYIAGEFSGAVDFDPGPGIFKINGLLNNVNGFISKIDSSGKFIWAKAFGNFTGGNITIVRNLEVSLEKLNNKKIYITGNFGNDMDADPGPGTSILSPVVSGSFDVFFVEIDSAGILGWAKQFGGKKLERNLGIETDNLGKIYVAGYFEDTVDFNTGPGFAPFYSNGSSDTYTMIYNKSGDFIWGFCMGGTNNDRILNFTIDSFFNIYSTGYFTGNIDFDPGISSYTVSPTGAGDIFIHKMSTDGVGIKELIKNKQLHIFPNPNSGNFSISSPLLSSETIQVEIFNTIGEMVYRSAAKNNSEINLPNFPKGVYFLKIDCDALLMTSKFIIN